MGWKGTLRSWEAASKRRDREIERQERLQIKAEKELEKLNDLLEAQEEVNEYEDYIDKVQSIHKSTLYSINWQEVLKSSPPEEPVKLVKNEHKAEKNYNNYRPNLFHKLFKRTEKIKSKLAQQIEIAKQLDEKNFKEALIDFEDKYDSWKKNVLEAQKVLAFEPDTIQAIIDKSELLNKIPEIGVNLDFEINDRNQLSIDIFLHSKDIIPKEVKTLLKSGKISIKDLPKSKYHELHQDYVCSVVLRIAREFFGLLPVNEIIITGIDDLLNKTTGHMEECPILSVLVVRATLDKLNFQKLDPSDAMASFLHHMSFKKTTGFCAIERIVF